MRLIADLHLHSKYSRAVSQQMVVSEIARWAKIKGIDLVGTADWTHPLWLRELKENLVEAGEGIYTYRRLSQGPKFILSTEIASIYSQAGKGRRIHNLILAPSFAVVEKINTALKNRGANLLSDGRPIIGLSSRDLAELVLGIDKNCLIICAHIWTPWFSLFGSKSGFNSIDECFGDMSQHIFAIETGLSSDPAMNWRIKQLDSRSIVSFSDAHSPSKLGREATIFEVKNIKKLNYQEVQEAIKNQQIFSTLEFYPQEGKYHYTGHRQCQVCQSPQQTKKLGTTCPVCGRPLTIGVMHRVEELATRPVGYQPPNRPPYKMMVPLMEILSEAFGVGVSSQKVQNEYKFLINSFSSEFEILLQTPLEKIAQKTGQRIADGIGRAREGKLIIDPGYDGVFGTIKIWPPSAQPEKLQKQISLF